MMSAEASSRKYLAKKSRLDRVRRQSASLSWRSPRWRSRELWSRNARSALRSAATPSPPAQVAQAAGSDSARPGSSAWALRRARAVWVRGLRMRYGLSARARALVIARWSVETAERRCRAGRGRCPILGESEKGRCARAQPTMHAARARWRSSKAGAWHWSSPQARTSEPTASSAARAKAALCWREARSTIVRGADQRGSGPVATGPRASTLADTGW